MLARYVNCQTLSLLTLSLALTVCIGCSSDNPKRAATARVHGELTLDGVPVDQATVVFLPVELRSRTGKLMPLAFGLTNAEGKFKLKYSDGGDELIAGQYTVIISKQTKKEKDVKNWATDLLPKDAAHFERFNHPDEFFPTIYNYDSILEYEVKPSSEISQTKFELSSIDPLLGDRKTTH